MYRRLYHLWLLCLLPLLPAGAQTPSDVQYVTERPRVDDANDPAVVIRRIELTSQYTIIYMSFLQRVPPGMRRLPRRNGEEWVWGGTTINFEPTARLYADGGARSYRFIRAENIPTTKRREVEAGVQVDFVAYFERLAPGIEVFDLFECSDRNRPGSTCFNFWGVHVINPDRRTARRRPPAEPAKPRPTPAPDVAKTTPAPVPKPKPAPAPAPLPPARATAGIRGTVRDAKTKKPLAATLSYQLLSGAEAADGPTDSVRSQAATGTYRIETQPVSVYAVTVTAPGYFPQRDTLAVSRTDLARDFALTKLETGAKITLRNIYFDASKYDLRPESFPELDRLAQLMRENPTMSIRLEGHTDIVGSYDANLELSRNRVNEVKRYLVDKGIAAGRIATIGYGQSQPINKNKTLKERPENRRVELVIVKV